MAGSIRVAGHTIAEHDIANDKVDIKNATLASSVTFPAGSTISGQVGGGHILQVQQKIKTDTFSTTSTTGFVTITGFNVQIQPFSLSNKVMVFVSLHIGESQDAFPLFRMYRDSTELQIANVVSPAQAGMFANVATNNNSQDALKIQSVNFHFFDSPNTMNSVTYSIKVRPMDSVNRTVYVNTPDTINNSNQVTAISTITAMEISA